MKQDYTPQQYRDMLTYATGNMHRNLLDLVKKGIIDKDVVEALINKEKVKNELRANRYAEQWMLSKI